MARSRRNRQSKPRDRSIAPTAAPAISPAMQTIVAVGVILLATVAAYHNSLSGPFIFDDEGCIRDNETIRSLWPIGPVLSPSIVGIEGRPLINVTLAVNYAISELDVWSYHVVNLVLHVLAAVTLFGVVRRTLRQGRLAGHLGRVATPLAAAVAVLWSVHPLGTESVTYVVQRCESVVGLLYLLTFYCVIRGAASARPIAWYAAAACTCLLGAAGKEIMATLPVLMLLYDRTFLAGSFKQALRRRWGVYAALAASWGLQLWLLLLTDFHRGTTGFAVAAFTWPSYLATQMGVVVHYLRLVVWPVGLCLDYDWPAATTIPQIVLPGLLVGWLIGMTVWAMVKRPAWGFVGAWFFVILAPTSSFIPINYAAAEHRMYLPLAAVVVLFVVAGWLAIQKLFDRSSASGAGRWAMPLMIVAGLTVALVCTTIARNADYRTSLAIWQDTVEKADHNPRAHNNVGVFLGLDGQGDAAIRHFRRAVDLKGDYHEAHTNLGVALTRRGDVAEAIVHLRTAVALEPNFAGAHNSLGNALIRDNKRDEAIKHYRRAIGINPRFAKAHNNLGLALVQTKDLTGAVHHFRTATEIAPLFADAFANLGLAMWQQGDLAGAAQAYENAVRLNPDDAETLTYFAWMLASGPSVTRDDAARAVTMARRACQLTDSRVAPSLDALAAALAADGRFSQAVPVAQRAAAVARSQGAGQLAGKIEMRLILYRAGRRYVRPAAGPK